MSELKGTTTTTMGRCTMKRLLTLCLIFLLVGVFIDPSFAIEKPPPPTLADYQNASVLKDGHTFDIVDFGEPIKVVLERVFKEPIWSYETDKFGDKSRAIFTGVIPQATHDKAVKLALSQKFEGHDPIEIFASACLLDGELKCEGSKEDRANTFINQRYWTVGQKIILKILVQPAVGKEPLLFIENKSRATLHPAPYIVYTLIDVLKH